MNTAMTRARCAQHKDAPTFPLGCPICVRIHLEARIVKKTVRALLDAGYLLRVADGESLRPEQPTGSSTDILSELMLVDDEYLQAIKDAHTSWVRFVYGNDGWDVINDYTVDLEDVLTPVTAYADRMGG